MTVTELLQFLKENEVPNNAEILIDSQDGFVKVNYISYQINVESEISEDIFDSAFIIG